MVFPSSIRDEIEHGGEAGYHLATGLVDLIPSANSVSDLPSVIEEATRADPAVRNFLAEHLPARYPSQLFEAALEGLLLFIVLLAVRLIFKRLPHGLLTGLFFVLYAIGRITAESFREPDASPDLRILAGAVLLVFYDLYRRRFSNLCCDCRTESARREARTLILLVPVCIFRTILTAVVSAILMLPQNASAVPSIVGGSTRAIPIVLTPLSGSSGEVATTTLAGDLQNAGVFDLTPPAETPSYSVTGSSSGGRIEGSLLKSDGTAIFTRSYEAASLRENAHYFADDIAASLTGRPGIAKSVIAFTIQKKGAAPAIHLCDADGGTLRRVSAPGEYAVSPAISPDAGYLVFTSYGSGYPEIQFLDLINGERHTLARSPGTSTDAAISPDGRSIAMAMSFTGNPEIFVASLGGSRAQLATSSPGAESGPTWSPDGRTLVYAYTDGRAPHLVTKKITRRHPLPPRHQHRICPRSRLLARRQFHRFFLPPTVHHRSPCSTSAPAGSALSAPAPILPGHPMDATSPASNEANSSSPIPALAAPAPSTPPPVGQPNPPGTR